MFNPFLHPESKNLAQNLTKKNTIVKQQSTRRNQDFLQKVKNEQFQN